MAISNLIVQGYFESGFFAKPKAAPAKTAAKTATTTPTDNNVVGTGIEETGSGSGSEQSGDYAIEWLDDHKQQGKE